jgi:hypothetical protein
LLQDLFELHQILKQVLGMGREDARVVGGVSRAV